MARTVRVTLPDEVSRAAEKLGLPEEDLVVVATKLVLIEQLLPNGGLNEEAEWLEERVKEGLRKRLSLILTQS
ncbi:hypothetical protein [Pyrodictium abyssi]|uniref:Uncharacterized protein n=1 Tax=Pyrodictium abyssi TaxID=54256 RepID=A0ABM8ITN9_9CREN|nr:hypothetical protein PABY_04850 [Pyrodictium abyssi]